MNFFGKMINGLKSLLKYWGVSRCADFWAGGKARGGSIPSWVCDRGATRHSPKKRRNPPGEASLGHLAAVARSLQPRKGMRVNSRRLAIWPNLTSRDIPQYFNRLLMRRGTLNLEGSVNSGDNQPILLPRLAHTSKKSDFRDLRQAIPIFRAHRWQLSPNRTNPPSPLPSPSPFPPMKASV